MEFELRYTDVIPEAWEALDKIPRIGWVKRGVKKPETVREHTISCRKLVIELIDSLTEFSMSDILEILNMLEVHDLPEVKTGDEPVITYNEEEKKKLKAEKFFREYNAMMEITKPLGTKGKEIFNLWLRFEKEDDRQSLFAKQIDKYQSIEKALWYQKNGESVVAQDFIDYYKKDIVHPVLKKRMNDMKKLYH